MASDPTPFDAPTHRQSSRDESAPLPTAGPRYEPIRLLGKGGMGEVWLVHDRELDRDVAIKYLSTSDADEIERLRREARTAARLEHPNIAAIHEFGNDGARAYLAMAYVDGRPLHAADLSLRKGLEAIRDAARAMAHAHAQGVIHRDLKPHNILIGADGRVAVLDFGLARDLSKADASMSESGMILGTPAYMAPEQAEGHVHVGAHADVWGLGATAYHVLCGEPPYRGASALEVVSRVLREDPVPLRKRNARIPREVETIVMKCLEREAARRYASATDLADDIDRYLRGEPIQAVPPGSLYRLRKRIARNPWAWAATLAVILVALAATVAMLAQRRSHEAEAAIRDADEALKEWRNERYFPLHDVMPARRKVEVAIGRLKRVLEIEADAHAAWAKLGWAHLQLGNTRKAREALEKALTLAEDSTYHWWLAKVYQQIERDEKRRARQLERSEDRRRALERTQQWGEKAREQILRALALQWSSEAVEREFAEAALLEPVERAVRYHEIGERHTRGGEEAWLEAAKLERDLPSAMKTYERAIVQAPSWLPPYAAAAQVGAAMLGQLTQRPSSLPQAEEVYRSALNHADRAVQCDEASERGWTSRGQVKLMWAQYRWSRGVANFELYRDAIEGDLTRAVEVEPESIEAWLWRGSAKMLYANALESTGAADPSEQYKRAIEDLSRVIKLDPGFHGAWLRAYPRRA